MIVRLVASIMLSVIVAYPASATSFSIEAHLTPTLVDFGPIEFLPNPLISGDGSNFPNLPPGASVAGHFSYDLQAPPILLTEFSARFPGQGMSLQLPSISLVAPSSMIAVVRGIADAAPYRIQSEIGTIYEPTGHRITYNFSLHVVDEQWGETFLTPLRLLDSYNMAASIVLLYLELSDETLADAVVGRARYTFWVTDITAREDASLGATPIPGALPMFVMGLGSIVFVVRCRDRRAAMRSV